MYIKGCTKHSPIPKNIIKIIFLFSQVGFCKSKKQQKKRKKKGMVFWHFALKVKFTLVQKSFQIGYRNKIFWYRRVTGAPFGSYCLIHIYYTVININNSINK